MLQSKQEKRREELRKAWEELDIIKLISLGFASFMDLLCGEGPIPFQKFLKYTGDFFDQYILDVMRKERLSYVGGKMVMELREARPNMPAVVFLFAEFYFQNAARQWVMKQKKGEVSIDRFSDWNSDADALKLQESGRLELSIEPPGAGEE